MKFFAFSCLAAFVATLANGNTFPITGPLDGVDAVTGSRPFRQDIKTFQKSGPAWDLYIQALQNFIDIDSSLLLSYYQVAGIHGYPNVPWDGVVGQSDGIGYCAHNTVTFPTWHRPYMALFEQIIWQNAQSIAQTYPASKRDTYSVAAKTLRIPFWDWSIDASIPTIVTATTVKINTANGSQTISNPLYTYVYPSTADFADMGDANFTARGPNADKILQGQAKGLNQATYALYSSQTLFASFANAAYYPPGAKHFPGFHPSNSLEHVHNTIHQSVGGQMADLSVTAFDPLFWLHHANVDRVFAIWEAIYPDQYTVPWNTTQSDYVIPADTTVDVNTPLYPFHRNDQGTFFTSADVQSAKLFGYTYPEVIDWGTNSDPAVLTANVTAIVNRIYNPSGSVATRHRRGLRQKGTTASDANAASYNWVIGIVGDKSLINQTLHIYFYVSSPPTDPTTWSTSTSIIGSDSINAILPATSEDSSSHFVTGQTFITHSLLEALDDISPSNSTLSFLKSNLQWRASYADGSVVSAEEMNELGVVQLSLMGQTVTQTPEVVRFPIYGDWAVYGETVLGAKGFSVL